MEAYFYTNIEEIERFKKGHAFEVWVENEKGINDIRVKLNLIQYNIRKVANSTGYIVSKV